MLGRKVKNKEAHADIPIISFFNFFQRYIQVKDS